MEGQPPQLPVFADSDSEDELLKATASLSVVDTQAPQGKCCALGECCLNLINEMSLVGGSHHCLESCKECNGAMVHNLCVQAVHQEEDKFQCYGSWVKTLCMKRGLVLFKYDRNTGKFLLQRPRATKPASSTSSAAPTTGKACMSCGKSGQKITRSKQCKNYKPKATSKALPLDALAAAVEVSDGKKNERKFKP